MAEIKSTVGRIVWGNPTKSQQKKDNNKQPIFKDGQPVMQWSFGVAFPKLEFQNSIWPVMHAEAMKIFPNGVPNGFAWKYVDGDGVDADGKRYSDREGYAGCYVLAINTVAFAPPVYKWNGSAYVQLGENDIKTGDYVVVALNIVGHVAKERTHNSGLYVNPVAIEHVGYGQAIFNGPDAMQLFGGAQYQLPAGASAQPVAPQGGVMMPGTGGMAQPMQMQPQQQPMQMQPQQQPMQMQPQQQPMQMQPQQQPMQMQPQQQGGGMPGYAPAVDYVQQMTGQPMQMAGQPAPMQQQPMQGGAMMPGMMPQR